MTATIIGPVYVPLWVPGIIFVALCFTIEDILTWFRRRR